MTNLFLEKLKAQRVLGKKMIAIESNATEVYVLIKDLKSGPYLRRGPGGPDPPPKSFVYC